MATVTTTAATFEKLIDRDGIVLIDWWAPWCGPCRMFGPIFENASAKHGDIAFAKINTDEEQDLAAEFQIQSIPMLMAFRDRVLVFAQAGALPAPALEQLIEQVRMLDMEQVKRELERLSKEAEAGGAEEDE
jgi:thioredoxin 1/thioredoxin 2